MQKEIISIISFQIECKLRTYKSDTGNKPCIPCGGNSISIRTKCLCKLDHHRAVGETGIDQHIVTVSFTLLFIFYNDLSFHSVYLQPSATIYFCRCKTSGVNGVAFVWQVALNIRVFIATKQWF